MFHNRAASTPLGATHSRRTSPEPRRSPGYGRQSTTSRRTPGPCAPHFTYGPTTKAEYEALHAMHLTNHLTALNRPPVS